MSRKTVEGVNMPQAFTITICDADKKNPDLIGKVRRTLNLAFTSGSPEAGGLGLTDAVKIVNFVAGAIRLKIGTMIISCEEGKVRSAGVAVALMHVWPNDLIWEDDRKGMQPSILIRDAVIAAAKLENYFTEPPEMGGDDVVAA